MKIIRPLSLIVLLLFVGCNNVAEPVEEMTTPVEWKFSVGTASRTSLGELDADNRRPIYWSAGDCIAINGVTSAPLGNLGEGVKYATFSFEKVLIPPYNVIYPASLYKDESTITLPTRRYTTPEAFEAPMAVCVEEDNVASLHHICAAIKLTLVKSHETAFSDKYPIKYVKFEGNNKEQVSGDFGLDYTTQTLTSLVEAPQEGYISDTRVVRTALSCTLTDEPVTLYIIVPAMEYANGFTIKIYNTQGHRMACTKSSAVTLAPGEIYTLPQVAYHPTYTEIEVGTGM